MYLRDVPGRNRVIDSWLLVGTGFFSFFFLIIPYLDMIICRRSPLPPNKDVPSMNIPRSAAPSALGLHKVSPRLNRVPKRSFHPHNEFDS